MASGLKTDELAFEPDAIRLIVRRYTREAGVRNLEREIAAVARKVARRLAEGQSGPFRVTADNLADYLGRPRFFDEVVERTARPGVATGLAWTPTGSDVAMTGEITLRGKVLPVGGIKEKVLAAHRVGIRTVILPRHNERDLEDVPAEVRSALRFVFADDAAEVLRQALTPVAADARAAAR